jgi:hypothetical protein
VTGESSIAAAAGHFRPRPGAAAASFADDRVGADLPIALDADEWLFWVGLSHPDEADLTTAVLAIGAAQALKITQQTAASVESGKFSTRLLDPAMAKRSSRQLPSVGRRSEYP